jgi:DNA polymerase III delta prime subunit
MTPALHKEILRSIEAAGDLYHRLVLLVGKASSGKTTVLREVAEELETEVINVNLVLSSELLELTEKQRSLRLPGLLEDVASKAHSEVVLDNMEILFDKDLKQDPLRLLQSVSRNHVVVATWNGAVTGNRLIYAEAGHPEYRYYDAADALIVNMDGTAVEDQ